MLKPGVIILQKREMVETRVGEDLMLKTRTNSKKNFMVGGYQTQKLGSV